MSEPSLQRELEAGVLTLRLNRPAKLNAIDSGLAQALLSALLQADRDDAVRVIVLRGNGRAFCAGRERPKTTCTACSKWRARWFDAASRSSRRCTAGSSAPGCNGCSMPTS